ncbi:hypothetical protein [Herbiconiux liangxiaofengii]|uniref:hypothetical protein n=1 Tax=Herbiconiux liangxiaofengii TaxID=3342795 RepID=UPI0035B711FC
MALGTGETTIDHRDHLYTLAGGPEEWAITRDGTLLGHLVVLSSAGEEGEPVYTTRRVDGTDSAVEGTDWDQVARALLNEVDPAIADPTSDVSGDGS